MPYQTVKRLEDLESGGCRWIVLCCGLLLLSAHAQEAGVTLPQGRIVGMQVYPEGARGPVEIYLGIPYATPPIGRLRFSAPGRHRGWNRTLFLQNPAPRCPQVSSATTQTQDRQSEDCLYLNVWTPQRGPRTRRLPVIVFLHSESWSRDTPVEFPGQDIASEGVVLVQPAFRLNVFGFFSLGSATARGNLGLLDQYMALLWVKENIVHFGGDPEAITLMGHSAGAMSVLYHIVSPRTEGLINRAIVMSPTDPWRALDEHDDIEDAVDTVRFSENVVALLGCGNDLDAVTIRCLQSKTTLELLNAYQRVYLRNNSTSSGMRPVCDAYLSEHSRYVPHALSHALMRRLPTPMPILFGTTDLEAINGNGDFWSQLRSQGTSGVMYYATLTAIPELLRLYQIDRPDTIKLLTEAVRWEYFGPESEDPWSASEHLARAESAARWGASASLVAARLSRLSAPYPLYVYRYTQPGGIDLSGSHLNYTGAAHGTDLVPIFGVSMLHQLTRRRATPDEEALTRLMRFVTNFAKFGNPVTGRATESWPAYRIGAAHVQQLQLDNTRFNHYGKSGNRDTYFWVNYLPRLANLTSPSLDPAEYIQQLKSGGENDGRLRGAVYSLTTVSILLVMLLCVCAVVMRRAARARELEAA